MSLYLVVYLAGLALGTCVAGFLDWDHDSAPMLIVWPVCLAVAILSLPFIGIYQAGKALRKMSSPPPPAKGSER